MAMAMLMAMLMVVAMMVVVVLMLMVVMIVLVIVGLARRFLQAASVVGRALFRLQGRVADGELVLELAGDFVD